jgi:hypothetical protein
MANWVNSASGASPASRELGEQGDLGSWGLLAGSQEATVTFTNQ